MAINTVNVTNTAELIAALADAVNQPISCININTDVIEIGVPLFLPKTLNTLSKTLVINGNGAVITPINGFSLTALMQRVPQNQAEATSGGMDNCKFIIRDLCFIGKNTTGNGIDLGATVGSVIENCTFKTMSTAIYLRYAPMTQVTNCNTINISGMSFVVDRGNWTNATNSNSQSGNVRFQNCRTNNTNSAYATYAIYVANNVVIDQCVIEGGSPQYHVYFDAMGNSAVQAFNLSNIQISAYASVASIKVKLAGGYAKLSGIYTDVDMTLVSAESTAPYPHLYIENIPILTAGTKFENLGSVVWSFDEVYSGETIFSAIRWIGGCNIPFYRYSEYFNPSKGIVTNLMKVNNKTIS